jgi:hypothetical protein
MTKLTRKMFQAFREDEFWLDAIVLFGSAIAFYILFVLLAAMEV